MSATEPSELSPAKRRVIRHFDHPNPAIVNNIAGGWWSVWNGLYYHDESGIRFARMHDGFKLFDTAVLYSECGITGHVLALENTDYVLDWPTHDEDPDFDPNEARPKYGLHEWMVEWMESHPDAEFDDSLAPPRCIHGSSLEETFTRGTWESDATDNEFFLRVIQGAGSRLGYLRVTPDRGDVLQVSHRHGNTKGPLLDASGWKTFVARFG